MEQAWERLAQVNIECLDYRDLIKKYDRPHTLFFLDPPYWNIPGYNYDFQESDFHNLRETLNVIQGKFLMTINDTPEIREIFSQYQIEEVQLKYSISREKRHIGKAKTELLISN